MIRPTALIASLLLAATLLVGRGDVHAAPATLTVTTPIANLRDGPAANQKVVGSIRRGEAITVEQVGPKYALIRDSVGQRAWIYWPAQGWNEAELLASVATPPAEVPEIARPAAGKATLTLSLADIGFKDGYHFEGAHSTHAQTFYFPVPHDGTRRGTLRLHLRTSDLLDPLSTLRVDLDDRPARQISLADRKLGEWLEIPVSGGDFTRDQLKVTVRVQLIASRDRCFDERALALHFVQLRADSRFDFEGQGAEDNLRSAWATLPNPVHLFATALTTPATLATTLEAGVHLHRMNRRIQWAASAASADVVIGDRTALSALAPEFRSGGEKDAGIALLHRPAQRPQILIADQTSPDLFASLQPGWVNLLTGTAYVRLGEATRADDFPAAVELSRLGLAGMKTVHRSAEWNFQLAAPQIPAHLKPSSLKLNFVGTPDREHSRFMLYVHLNGQLQEVRALDVTGRPQSVSFALGAAALRTGNNSIRIVVQRLGQDGNCSGEIDGIPFEILPGSAVALFEDKEAPKRFSDLRAAFSRGMEVHVERTLLADPARLMPFLIGVIGSHEYPIDRTQVRLLDEKASFKPGRPFLLLSPRTTTLTESPVRFDQGAVRVIDEKKRTILAVDALPGLTIAQLARQEGQPGLWLVPATDAALPGGRELFLDQDDLAFADDAGAVLTVDSRSPQVARVDYPEYSNWLDFIERHRFWLIALGWTVIIVLMVQLYRKTQTHRSLK